MDRTHRSPLADLRAADLSSFKELVRAHIVAQGSVRKAAVSLTAAGFKVCASKLYAVVREFPEIVDGVPLAKPRGLRRGERRQDTLPGWAPSAATLQRRMAREKARSGKVGHP